MLQERVMHLVTPITESDVTHTDALVGPRNSRITGRCRHGGAFGKIPTCKIAHHALTLNHLDDCLLIDIQRAVNGNWRENQALSRRLKNAKLRTPAWRRST